MAKKEKEEAKKAEAGKEGEAKEAAPDTPEKAGKKRKILLLAGIGGVMAVALGGGGFFAWKTFLHKPKVEMSAKDTKKDDGHGDAKDAKDAKKDDAHGEPKKDAKDAKKDDAHGDTKDAKKDDAHGDAKDAKKDDSHGDAKKEDGNGEPKKDGKEDKDTREKSAGFGETYDMPKMDLNLGNPLENRFLRIGITLEFHGGEKQKEELKKREPQLKDIVISSVSGKTRMQLLDDRGKERLRRDLTNRFNEVLERPVKSLFFTDFLVE